MQSLRRRARDRDRNPSRPRPRRDLRPSRPKPKPRLQKRGLETRLETETKSRGSITGRQGRSQDLSKGGWNYGSKSYEKEKLLVIRIARKAHILWMNSWLYSPRNLGSLQLNCHLVSLIFFHGDRKTQPPWLHVSAEFCFDLWFFSTFGKHISHVHVFFIFA